MIHVGMQPYPKSDTGVKFVRATESFVLYVYVDIYIQYNPRNLFHHDNIMKNIRVESFPVYFQPRLI